MFKKNLFLILILLLLLFDVSYSFRQHLHTDLDGDMADIIVPSEWCKKVFEDPFGFSVLFKNEVYAAPNRFFALWTFSKYFKILPGLLQNFFNPIDSVYIAAAIGKTAIQLFLMLLMSAYISGKKNILTKEFLLSAALVTPFFITYQYWRLGIIDRSVTFTFTYALPLGLLLLFYLPFFRAAYYEQPLKLNLIHKIFLVLLAIVITLNGALVPGVAIIVCSLALFHNWYYNFKAASKTQLSQRIIVSIKKIPREFLFYFVLLIALSLYSLYIGMNNIENDNVQLSLIDRYLLLPNGIYKLFINMSLVPPLIFMIIVNVIIIKKYFKQDEAGKILRLLKWFVIFCFIYIMLLPLGGFRWYRPEILRYDTFMPVTIGLIILFGISTNYLVSNITSKFKIAYLSVISIFLLFYIFSDKSNFGTNKCERNSLYIISQSKEKIVLISSDCPVMSWGKITDYNASGLNAELIQYWGITKEKKLYYQK